MRPNADVGFSDRYLYESQLRCPILIPTASKFAIHRLPRRSEAYRQAPCLDGVDDEIIEWLSVGPDSIPALFAFAETLKPA